MKPAHFRWAAVGLVAILASTSVVCGPPPVIEHPPAHSPSASVSAAPVEPPPRPSPRLVPVEAYVRTYLTLFGELTPLGAQMKARGNDGAALFDTWNDYVGALGLPDYRVDAPRGANTNPMMLAAFERLGVVLCARALENDWRTSPRPPVEKRLVFAFDPPDSPLDKAAFAAGFDVLHRTFLAYPSNLAGVARAERFYTLWSDVRARRTAPGALQGRFSPDETAWIAVCEAFVEHPEFHFY
ncbi:MAG: hypothetical protein IPK82_39815 [Polyangiaceae bacterium]|nr:hypothetical protein [Polyangiaceae bacterium]